MIYTVSMVSVHGVEIIFLLNAEECHTLKEAEVLIERWRQEYNTVRPHSSLNYQPPAPAARLPLVPSPDTDRFSQILT